MSPFRGGAAPSIRLRKGRIRVTDLKDFRKYLKARGKKDHVADDLCRRVALFESFLGAGGKPLDHAGEQDIREYAGANDGEHKNDLRALGLYYSFRGRQDLARSAGSLRESAIAADRSPFLIRKFLGVNPGHMDRLAAEGIVNVAQMVARGATPEARRALSAETGIGLASIEEYVKLSDISRIGAVKTKRARLYIDAGLDTIDKIAALSPEALVQVVKEFIRRTGFDGVPTLPKEAENTVRKAREIQRLVVWG